MQSLGSKRDGTRLMENRKQFHLVGTWSAECWGEEDVGGGVHGGHIMKVFVNQFWLFLGGLK